MRSISVVVTGDTPTATAVRSLVAEWTRVRITEPSLWVREADMVRSDGQPPQVFAWLVDPDGEERVDLFAHLGRFRLDRVRIVVTQLAATTEEADPKVSAVGELVADLVRQALPRDPSGTDLTSLHRTLLLVPATDVRDIDSRVLLPSWEANVVVSPEDRPDLDRSSVFVRPATNYAGHAAAAVAAAAGLVRGVPGGVFDRVGTDSSTRPDDVVVARVAIRTVVGEDVLDVLGRRTLDPETLAPVGPGQVVGWATPASDPELLVRRAANAILTTPEWAPTPEPDRAEPQPEQVALAGAFGRAARFSLHTVGAVAAWTFGRGRDAAERTATRQVVGADVGSVVTLGPRAVDSMSEVATAILTAKRSQLAEALTYEATRGAPPAPTTWSTLRQLCFALADGGPVDGMDTPRQLGQREVLGPREVGPRPGSAHTALDGRMVAATDPPAMRSYLADLEAQLRERKDEVGELRRLRDAAERDLPPGVSDPTATTGPGATGADDDAVDPLAAARERWEADRTAVLERLRAAEDEAERVGTELATFREWFADQACSVLWQVGDDVARRLAACEDGRRAWDGTERVTAPATASLDAAKRRLLRRWWVTSGLGVLALVVLGLVVQEQESPDWGTVAWWTTGIVVTTVGLLALFNHVFYKAFRRYEWEVRTALARQRAEAATFLWRGKERGRLAVLYQGWRDWTEVIAEVVHRPWEPPAVQVHELAEEVVGKLPAAMAAARQQEEQLDLPATLLARAYGAVYREGWAQQAFDAAYERLAGQELLTASSGYLDVDVDMSPSAISPRGRLLEMWQSGSARAMLGEIQAGRLREAVLGGDLVLPLRRVERIGPHSDNVWRDEPEYFAALATSETTFALDVFGSVARTQNRHYAGHVTVWLPQSAHSHATRNRSSRVAVEPAEAATAVRVDLSRRIPPQDLAIFVSPQSWDKHRTAQAAATQDTFL
ncbi:hypothetical protein FE251_06515 [Georgenia wutianyii]|uniref:Uncharacterized protein n=1 Tax=Georgenia wutianyii TaxID=2585135 RepID=A0ABX5VMZ0_9MICO|nr:hypothetical protein [Georgenia wutianyii]QDB79061.1 hypothetical protein FE251_06515 [Georgenia wutianyii]